MTFPTSNALGGQELRMVHQRGRKRTAKLDVSECTSIDLVINRLGVLQQAPKLAKAPEEMTVRRVGKRTSTEDVSTLEMCTG